MKGVHELMDEMHLQPFTMPMAAALLAGGLGTAFDNLIMEIS